MAVGVHTWCSGVFDPMESGKFGPEKIVDGDDQTRWCGHPPEIAWIALDLGASKELHSIRIRYERLLFTSLF